VTLTTIFIFINTLIATGIAVTAFSLMLYVVRYNWSSPVARAFVLILAGTIGLPVGPFLGWRYGPAAAGRTSPWTWSTTT